MDYFGVVARTPGFPRALARTLTDVRLAGIKAATLAGAGRAGHDLAALVSQAESELADASTADRAALLAAAAAGVDQEAFLRAPLLLLDLAVENSMEEAFVARLTAVATEVLATLPAHDLSACLALERCGGALDVVNGPRRSDLDHLRACLFSGEAPERRVLDGSLELFSAPGEGRECVEVARRILREARNGVPFDEMAVFVRSPEQYHGLLEHAFERARIHAWFDRGTRRPHPAGRAFLALLACAAEGLSASRFAEYLSLGQLPEPGQDQPAWLASEDEVFGAASPPPTRSAPVDRFGETHAEAGQGSEGDGEQEPPVGVEEPGRAAHAGNLRTPRRWERLIVEAAVIGGEPARWTRRLNGLEQEFQVRLDQARREDVLSPRVAAIEDDLRRLDHLRAFALPLIAEMAAWPPLADWGEWLDRLDHLAPQIGRAHV